MKNTPRKKIINCPYNYQCKKSDKKKMLSPFLKIGKLIFGKKNKEKERKHKYRRINKNICMAKENKKKAKKCKSLGKHKKKIKSPNSDVKKVVFKKFSGICTCEMCQLFNIGEDKFADIQGVDYNRSRERLRRKIRKRWKETKK